MNKLIGETIQQNFCLGLKANPVSSNFCLFFHLLAAPKTTRVWLLPSKRTNFIQMFIPKLLWAGHSKKIVGISRQSQSRAFIKKKSIMLIRFWASIQAYQLLIVQRLHSGVSSPSDPISINEGYRKKLPWREAELSMSDTFEKHLILSFNILYTH